MRISPHPARAELAARLRALGDTLDTSFEGELFRFIDPRFSKPAQIVDGVGALRVAGRWNLRGVARISYTSLAPETALSEALAHVTYYRLPRTKALPRVLVALRLKAGRVLDLRVGTTRTRLRLAESTIRGLDWRSENRRGREAVTQAWGAAFAQAGFEAVMVPSAADSNGTIVLVFPENLSAGSRFCVEDDVKWPAT